MFLLFSKTPSQFDLFVHFTEEDVKHYFLPIENVIYAYVVESEEKKITDFFSFYCLPSTIINHPKHSQLRAAYSYYHVSTVTPLNTLINNALILAKKNNFDVFNALNLMENESFLQVNIPLISYFSLIYLNFYVNIFCRNCCSVQETVISITTCITGSYPKNSSQNNSEWCLSENTLHLSSKTVLLLVIVCTYMSNLLRKAIPFKLFKHHFCTKWVIFFFKMSVKSNIFNAYGDMEFIYIELM